MSLKNSDDNIGNRNRDLPVCSVVLTVLYCSKIMRHYLELSPGFYPSTYFPVHRAYSNIHSFSILCDDRSKASSKTSPPHSAI